MSSNSPSKKRKADEINKECVHDVPRLPAQVWGGILDFMPYAEVRSALLVGKHIAVEAAKYVRTISVLNSSEMYAPAARRFPNVEGVHILCLLNDLGTIDGDGYEEYTVSLETAHSTPSFLSAFPRLKRAFVGGRIKDTDDDGFYFRHYRYMHVPAGLLPPQDRTGVKDKIYNPVDCIGPEGHEEIIRGLIAQIGGAFKSGLLSPALSEIHGVCPHVWKSVRQCPRKIAGVPANVCLRCHFLCRNLPLAKILGEEHTTNELETKDLQYFCLQEHQFWEIVRERPGGKEVIKDATEVGLCGFIYREIGTMKGLEEEYSEKIKPLMEKYSRTSDDTSVMGLSKYAFLELDKVIEAGLDPRRIRKKEFFKQFEYFIGDKEDDDLNIWLKSTVIGLADRGFPVSCDEFITIDDEDE